MRETERRKNEIRYQKDSLDLYERKVQIHSKNPNVEWALSEAEKDKALDRYLEKNQLQKIREPEKLEKATLLERVVVNQDKKLEKKRNTVKSVKERPALTNTLLVLLPIVITILTLLSNTGLVMGSYCRETNYYGSCVSYGYRYDETPIIIAMLLSLVYAIVVFANYKKIDIISKRTRVTCTILGTITIVFAAIATTKFETSAAIVFILNAIALVFLQISKIKNLLGKLKLKKGKTTI